MTASAALTHTAEKARLLLVEDDEIFAELTQTILAARGFAAQRTVVAGSIGDASRVLRSDAVDLIVADLTLPDASGLEVVRRCQEVAPHVPIIVLTATRDVDMALEALEKGAQDYLIKGEFDDEDLMRAIRYALARSRAEADLRGTMRALEVSNHQLEESNSQLEEYATIASHDLRSPVRTARVLVGRLAASDSWRGDPKSAELVVTLDACLGRLESMLEGLLDYAQARDLSSSGEFHDEVVSSVVNEILLDMDADLRECGAQVEVVGDASVRAHPVLIRSLLLNVVRNAVKYRSDRPLHVVISAQATQDEKILVTVADNGIGIEPRFRTRVFAMFERLSSRAEGIGLGLSLCHRIVSLHRGRIWIENGLDDAGISMCFTLPATPGPGPAST
jgi:signal transduction histidine kinase